MIHITQETIDCILMSTGAATKTVNGKPLCFDCGKLINCNQYLDIFSTLWQLSIPDILYSYPPLIASANYASAAFASNLAHATKLPLICVDKNRIIGSIDLYRNALNKCQAVLVSDFITDGKSELAAIQTLRDHDIICSACLTVIIKTTEALKTLEETTCAKTVTLTTVRSVTTFSQKVKI